MVELKGLKEKKMSVTCNVPVVIDEMLYESADKTGRTKKREAELRLEDHVRRFSSIEQIGVVTERKTDD